MRECSGWTFAWDASPGRHRVRVRAIDRTDLADDPALDDNAGRDARADAIYAAIDAWVSRHDAATVLERLKMADVPVSSVYSVADMFADPQFVARGMFESLALPGGGQVRAPGVVPKLGATPGGTEWPGPALGAHTGAVLASLGMTDAQIVALRDRGVI